MEIKKIYKALILTLLTSLCSAQAEKKALKSVKSPVPSFEFADQLQEQEAQLAENPMLKRFAKERTKYLSDPYCPSYHFVNPEGRMNDPNGLCFWQGRWHLFYQAYPPETDRTHWGHAVSTDLVHWRDLPYAIYPDIEKSSYSGNTLVEQDRVIAMYHGVGAGSMIATATDPLLLNWEKSAANPVIPMFRGARGEAARRRGPDGSPLPYRIHDPFLWRKGDFYYAITSGTLPAEGKRQYRANFLHRSDDLKTWEYLHPFDEGDRFTLVGDDGACPYFLPIGKRYMLATFSHQSGSQYLLGDYDKQRDKFVVSSHGRFTFNASRPSALHAPSVAPSPSGDGSLIAIFNMNAQNMGYPAFRQVMSLPRRLWLEGSDDLRVAPAGEIESLRGKHQSLQPMTLPANKEVVLDDIKGNAMEIKVVIAKPRTSMFELCVLRSPNKEEYTRIMYYPNRGLLNQRRFGRSGPQEGLLSIDSSYSTTSDRVMCRAPETGPVQLDNGEDLTLRVFIDRSVVEVFANDKQCLAIRVFPKRADSIGVSLRSQGQETQVKSLDAWEMKSIW